MLMNTDVPPTEAQNGSLTALQKAQVLRLVTRSFVSELLRYGLPRADLVKISSELLDHAMDRGHSAGALTGEREFSIRNVLADRETSRFAYREVAIRQLVPEDIPLVAGWLSAESNRRAFYSPFPPSDRALSDMLLGPSSAFFGITSGDTLVGLIGGAREQEQHARVELRKLIGERQFRGRGIAKVATFLWLHYIFDVLGLNKVFLYSLDTNIKNVNLNSRFGFEVEGILKEELVLDGMPSDVLRMGLTRSRWLDLVRDTDPVEAGLANS
jgi:RimJ/RimL family protein N-acetyltransferase